MKKIIAIFLSLFILCFVGCSDNVGESVDTQNDDFEQEVSGPEASVQFELKGTVERATDFSNGYAIVKTKEEDNQNYWINKDGEVLAVLPSIVFAKGQTYAAKTSEIVNGFMLVGEFVDIQGYTTLCDIEGNVYKAEDFGVTAFHPDALADGYIITSTATDGGKIEIGVVDSELMQSVEPSEELAKVIGVSKLNGAQNISKYYKDYLVYGKNGSFDVRNGDIVSKTLEDAQKEWENLSEKWELENGSYGYFKGDKFVPKVNLYKLRDLDFSYVTLKVNDAKFVDGRAPVIMGTHDEQTAFTLIDERGNMVFEPVDFGVPIKKVLISNGYILVVGEKGEKTVLKTYDITGKLQEKLESKDFDGLTEYSFCDGVIKIEQKGLSADGVDNVTTVYNYDFTKLF